MADTTPDSYSWEFHGAHEASLQIRRQKSFGSDDWSVCVYANGLYCSGNITMPMWLWQTLLTATFTPPVAVAFPQTVTVRLETAPIRVETAQQAIPTSKDPVDEARKALDRPVNRS